MLSRKDIDGCHSEKAMARGLQHDYTLARTHDEHDPLTFTMAFLGQARALVSCRQGWFEAPHAALAYNIKILHWDRARWIAH